MWEENVTGEPSGRWGAVDGDSAMLWFPRRPGFPPIRGVVS